MFEREIKFIYDFNINKLNSLGSFFSFQQLRESDIHPAIIQYMSAELDYLIFEDRQKLVKDSIFDYSNEKVAKHFSVIGEELKKSKRLSSDYAAKLILHAISFNVNFLVRPKWALVKFIFEEESHRSAADIKQLLNYLHFYKYLRKILVSYLNNKKIISMNSAEFVELLNKIDELTIESSFNDMISSSLKSMAEFFNIGAVQKTKIPFNAIQIYLDEKGLEHHLSRLRDVYSDDVSSRIELNDAVKLLTSIMVEKVEITAEPGKEEEIIEEETLLAESFTEKEFVEKTEVNPEEVIEEDKAVVEEDKAVVEEEETNFDEDEIEKVSMEEDIPVKPEEYKDEIENIFVGKERVETFDIPVVEEKEEPEPVRNNYDDEIVIETEKDSDDEWEFVEEEEHADLIKEIAEAAEPGIKKPKQGKKKTSTDDEDLLLFNENEEKIFNKVLEEEEKAYKEDIDISGSFDETHKDFTKLLEHKSMSGIIDVLFDNDIEEVELMLNTISFFTTYAEAERFIDTYFVKMGIKLDSVEAVTFKKIIRDNYNIGRQ